ncbi:MAG TPA: HdeD family acid-resistance protein [Chthoniobacterales bacterium]|nr:HdeD family acid-resistance protein [Chthoniobacterales bacterium]
MNESNGIGIATVADTLSHNWWLLALRGLTAVIFGVLTFIWPAISLFALIMLFGAFALVNGVLSVFLAAKAPKGYPRFGSLLIGGLLGIFTGFLTFFWPGLTALGLLIMIAAWAIATGVMEIVAAIKLRKKIKGEWLLVLAGICSVAFGIMLLLMPGPGALVLVLWIGAYALVSGILLIILAFKMRKLGNETDFATAAARA